MTGRRLLLAVSLLMAFTSCADKARDIDCDLHRTGSFYMKAKDDIPPYSISRTDSLQYETNMETGGTRVFQVKWTGDCEFQMQLLDKSGDSASHQQSAFRDSIEQIPSTVSLLETAPSYYIFEIRKKDLPAYIDTLWVKE